MITVAILINGNPLVARNAINTCERDAEGRHGYHTDSGEIVWHRREDGAVVLAHNLPSGTALPSRADEALTSTLKSALSLIDVRVLDHIIVAGAKSASMAEMGLV